MNKRISTLMTAGLLMLGSLFSNAQAAPTVADFTTVVNGAAVELSGYYLLGDATNGFLKAKAITGKDKKTYTVLDATGLKPDEVTAIGDISDYVLWEIVADYTTTGGSATKTLNGFKFVNKATKASLKLVDATDLPVDGTDMSEAVEIFTGDLGTDANVDGKIDFSTAGKIEMTTNGVVLAVSAATSVAAIAGATEIKVYSVNAQPVVALTLNAARGGLGFALVVDGKTVEDNIFAQTLKAFDVKNAITEGTSTIPAGTYFATSYPAKLAKTSVIDNAEDFGKCTFIVIDPVENFAINALNRADGFGYKFTTVAGTELNTYNVAKESLDYEAKNATSGTDVFVGNAAFTITEKKPLEAAGKYELSLNDIRVKVKTTEAAHANKGVKINYIETNKLITTAGSACNFVVSSSTMVRPYELLNTTAVASVYNIKFMSKGNDPKKVDESEYGKYLGVGSLDASAYEYLALGSDMVNLNNPQYQFVISKVDSTTNNVVTFTLANRENKNETIDVQLFKTDKTNEYIVVELDATTFKAAYIGDDEKTSYSSPALNLNGTTIKLTPATVDKFAGYANRTSVAPITMKFAKDATATDKLFVTAVTAGFGADIDEAKATQFELIKSEEEIVAEIPYIYLKSGKAAKATAKDTVAFYTYKVKQFNAEDNDKAYLGASSWGKASAASEFVIKENLDGSIALITLSTDYDGTITYNATCVAYAVSAPAGVIKTEKVYAPDAANLPLFIVEETPASSLEAVARHAAFNAASGFISINAKNEAVMSLATEATQALTFWLDSADSNTSMPSFFISAAMDKAATKAAPAAATQRLFMYFAQDSADYALNITKNKDYQLPNGDTKLIFKPATLVNSDTLSTSVKGKTALVAAKKDVDGTLAGLDYFQFQILKVADSDNEYIIRNKKTREYVVNINGALTVKGNADAAMAVVLEDGISTGNGEITASTISVIAKTGAVEIAGAAGKTVVISNILGQIVANTVITSDNATIAAPQGIVVVSVEGEEAVKAVVR